MNHWAAMLGAVPATLQRLIARTQRISLPRGCAAPVRVERLRQALCHAATVRVSYALLDPAAQAALQELRPLHGGISPAALAERFGAVRSWTQLAADPTPRTISERLILLGWLLPRPAAPRHPPRFLLPPELRRWLPHPLRLESLGVAPVAPEAPAVPPAVRAAAAILLACAARPLDLGADGRPRRAGLALLAARLAPLPATEVADLCAFLWPLLTNLGLLDSHAGAARLTPAGQRFLGLAPAAQRDQLHAAWIAAPDLDDWLRTRLLDPRGINAPLLRRRLVDWAALLPVGHCFAPAALYPALSAALGPLADTHTHGFRTVDRAPWQPKRAAAIFAVALRGPLRWLGCVAWMDGERQWADDGPRTNGQPGAPGDRPGSLVYRPLPAACAPQPWQYGAPGLVIVPHAAAQAAVLRLLPFAEWHAADAAATTYRITPAGLVRAASAGWGEAALWSLLDAQAGSPPVGWREGLAGPATTIRIEPGMVVTVDEPAVLDRAARARSVRRYLPARLAPGVAVIEPDQVAPLVRALERQGIATQAAPAPAAPPPAELSAGECAALLVACAFYRRHAPAAAPLLPHDQLAQRLRAALPPPLRAATDAALVELAVLDQAPPAAVPWQPEPVPTPTPLVELSERIGPALSTAEAKRESATESRETSGPGDTETGGQAPARATGTAPGQAPLLAIVRRAISARQAITISYTNGQGEMSIRHIRPLELEQRYDTWYLRAYCTTRRAERTFRVDRIAWIE